MDKRLLSSTILASLVVAIGLGCGKKGMEPEDIADGNFEATVSGSINLKLNGCASFVSVPGGYFQLALLPISSSGLDALLTLARGNSSVPGVGTYNISEEDASNSPQDFVGLFSQSSDIFLSQSGSLNVTSSNPPDRFAGSFTFTATNGASQTVTISGKFNAKSGPCTSQQP